MQARLEVIRFPAFFFAIVFALAAALSLGAVLGYTLKPSFVTQGRTEVVYVQGQGGPSSDLTRALPTSASAPSSSGDECRSIDGKKAC